MRVQLAVLDVLCLVPLQPATRTRASVCQPSSITRASMPMCSPPQPLTALPAWPASTTLVQPLHIRWHEALTMCVILCTHCTMFSIDGRCLLLVCMCRANHQLGQNCRHACSATGSSVRTEAGLISLSRAKECAQAVHKLVELGQNHCNVMLAGAV